VFIYRLQCVADVLIPYHYNISLREVIYNLT